MKQTIFADHLERVKAAVAGTYGLHNLDQYLTKKTFLKDTLFSFKDHEFQLEIVKDTAPTTITVKIAQVGLSEIAYRWSLAAVRVTSNFTVIYTFPNAGDAASFAKTRIDPIINGSPDLKQAINSDLNNSEIKQFGTNSFLYMRGTRSQAGAISVPADAIVHDEWDKSDTTTASMFIARLQHSNYRLRKLFSTPTIKKFGILKEAETANRRYYLKKCKCCNHLWLPDYFQDVKIPGYDGDLKELTRHNIRHYQWAKAALICPKCGKEPGNSPENMQWVTENSGENYHANAYFVGFHCAPNIITPAKLVHDSTQYEKYSEFMNQGLGLAAEEEDDTITETDLDKAILKTNLMSSNLHIFAADMGTICHVMIGRMAENETMLVVHKERVPLNDFEKRRRELLIQYHCALSIHDSQPYTDMISRLTLSDLNAYGAIFTTFKAGPVVRIQEQEEEKEEGKLNFRMAKIRREMALDGLLATIKRGELAMQSCELDEEFKLQMQSLKRTQRFDSNNELTYAWEKTGQENDHFHFTLLYLWIGLKLRGVAVGTSSFLTTLPLMQCIRMRNA